MEDEAERNQRAANKKYKKESSQMYHCQSVKCNKNRHKRVKLNDHMKLKTHAHDDKNKLAQLLKLCKSPCEFCKPKSD